MWLGCVSAWEGSHVCSELRVHGQLRTKKAACEEFVSRTLHVLGTIGCGCALVKSVISKVRDTSKHVTIGSSTNNGIDA